MWRFGRRRLRIRRRLRETQAGSASPLFTLSFSPLLTVSLSLPLYISPSLSLSFLLPSSLSLTLQLYTALRGPFSTPPLLGCPPTRVCFFNIFSVGAKRSGSEFNPADTRARALSIPLARSARDRTAAAALFRHQRRLLSDRPISKESLIHAQLTPKRRFH